MGQTNREHLKRLLAFLNSEIIHEPENKWFVDELHKLLPNEKIISMENSLLLDIREQCIEEILKDQAQEFYKHFPIDELKPQLIRDFVKMEIWRRRNNLQEFCLALYQQVECVVNYLANVNEVSDVILALITAPAYLSPDTENLCERNEESTYRIANLLFMREAPAKAHKIATEQKALDKFRVIYYFICKRGKLKSTQYDDFVRETNLLRDIYSLRNQNHRGQKLADWESLIDQRIKNSSTLYYFRFLDFLATFVQGIIDGYPMSEELTKYSKTYVPTTLPQGPKVVDKIDLKDDGRNRFPKKS